MRRASFTTLVFIFKFIFESVVFIGARFAGLYCSGGGKFQGCYSALYQFVNFGVCGKVSQSSGIPPKLCILEKVAPFKTVNNWNY